MGELSDVKPKPLILGSLAVTALALLFLLLAQLPTARPLDAAGPQATPPAAWAQAVPTATGATAAGRVRGRAAASHTAVRDPDEVRPVVTALVTGSAGTS